MNSCEKTLSFSSFIIIAFSFVACLCLIPLDVKAENTYVGYGKIEDSDTERHIAEIHKVNVPHGTAYNYLTKDEQFLYDAIYIAGSDYSKLPDYVPGHPLYNLDSLKSSYKFYEGGKPITDIVADFEFSNAFEAIMDDFPDRIIFMGEFGDFSILYCKENGKDVAYMVVRKNRDVNMAEEEKKLNAAAQAIASKCTGDTKAENELQALEYYVKTLTYEYGDNDNLFDQYGALIIHRARCVGYAYGFDLIMKKLGIECLNICGTMYLGGHQWNMVKLDDNEWYEVDATAADADDNAISHLQFNKTTADYEDYTKNDSVSYRRNFTYVGSYYSISCTRYPLAYGTKYTYAYLRPGYNDDGTIPATSVKYNSFDTSQFEVPELRLHVGDTFDVSATAYPETANDRRTYVFSSDTSVATIDGNTLTAVGVGVTGITAYLVNDTASVGCTDWFQIYVVADDVAIDDKMLHDGNTLAPSVVPDSSQNDEDSWTKKQDSDDTGSEIKDSNDTKNAPGIVTKTDNESIDSDVPAPKKLSVRCSGKKVTVKWKKQTNDVNGYEIQYSTDKNFNKNVKKISAKKSDSSKNIKGLKAGKNYYVRIRTKYKVYGRTVYSKWSKAKKVKIKE